MKRIIYTLISLIILTTLSSSVNAQSNDGLKELYSIKGVTSIYVSKSMLSLVKNKSFGHDAISSVVQYLDAIEIFNSDNEESVGKVKTIIDKFITSSGMEILTKIKQDDENVLITGKSNGTQFTHLLMLIEEDSDELTLINMTGKIPLEKISELSSGL